MIDYVIKTHYTIINCGCASNATILLGHSKQIYINFYRKICGFFKKMSCLILKSLCVDLTKDPYQFELQFVNLLNNSKYKQGT